MTDKRQRLRAIIKRDHDWLQLLVVRWPANVFVRLIGDTRVSPNQASLAAFVVGMAGAVLVALCLERRAFAIAGGLLMLASLILDSVDGQLARYQERSSPFGSWLDGWLDRVRETAEIMALTWVYAAATKCWWVLLAGQAMVCVFMVYNSYFSDELFPFRPPGSPTAEQAKRREVVAPLGRRYYKLIPFLTFNFGQRQILLVLAAVIGAAYSLRFLLAVFCFYLAIGLAQMVTYPLRMAYRCRRAEAVAASAKR